jgi:hypothetical protein
MDRERLKELREETEQYRAVADDRCMSTQYEDDMLAMIDAALVEPSDADVAEAIEWHDNQRAGCAVSFKNFDKEEKYFELAIQALRQYQKPKLCRLCNDEIDHEDVDLCSACINTLELYQYQKPTDEEVRDCSTCIGCDCEPEFGETVKDCKAYVKREQADIADAIEAMTDNPLYNADIRKTILTALLDALRWIPVSDRLPTEELASVLVYTKDGGVSEGQYYPTIKSWKQFRWSVENATVTHWMPLPKPPESEG